MQKDRLVIRNGNANTVLNSRASRAVLEVDLDAIKHNLELIRELCPTADVLPVLKGDAYGVGARIVSSALQSEGVKAFAVDSVAEGIELRESGVIGSILLLDGCLPENAELAIKHQLIPGIASQELLLAYEKAARELDNVVPIWLGYNCGFNRSGNRSQASFLEFVRTVSNMKRLDPIAVYAHLPAAHVDLPVSESQANEYDTAYRLACRELDKPLGSSLLASHSILAQIGTHGDWVRPGIILYGTACFEDNALSDEILERVDRLKPALTLKTRVIHKLSFDSAQYCGLGQKFEVKPGQTLATLAIGFGNGLPVVSSRPELEAKVGSGDNSYSMVTVGMDYSQIDLTNRIEPELYDWVTLFGDPSLGHQSIGEFAEGLGMSPWVLMRQLNVARSYQCESPQGEQQSFLA